MVKEFDRDARTIISKLHHYHTESNVAKHEVVTLTTYITNLSLTDNWKGTTCQFLIHFKEILCLLDSLVPDTDKIPETVGITFLQRAVQKNNVLRQTHVLDSVWRSKTGSTGKFTLEVYNEMNLILNLMKEPYLIKKRLILPNIQSFNLLSILLNLENLPRFSSLINSGVSFLQLHRCLSLNTTTGLKWLTLNNISIPLT